MDSRACSCIWLPEWGQMTIPVMPDTGTEATIRLRQMRVSWLISSSRHVLFPESLCVHNLYPHAEPKVIKNYGSYAPAQACRSDFRADGRRDHKSDLYRFTLGLG